jgi:ribosomal protein S6
MEENTKDKKEYELSYLAKDESSAAEVSGLVRSLGGETTLERQVNKIALAYPVKKETQAFFGFLQFMFSPDQSKPLTDALGLKAGVLRYLLVTPPPMKGKKAREGRPEESDRPRPAEGSWQSRRTSEPKAAPLSNEALEKKIEEILQ